MAVNHVGQSCCGVVAHRESPRPTGGIARRGILPLHGKQRCHEVLARQVIAELCRCGDGRRGLLSPYLHKGGACDGGAVGVVACRQRHVISARKGINHLGIALCGCRRGAAREFPFIRSGLVARQIGQLHGLARQYLYLTHAACARNGEPVYVEVGHIAARLKVVFGAGTVRKAYLHLLSGKRV